MSISHVLKSGIGCAILGLRGKVWTSSLHCAILEFLVRAEHNIINACVTLRNAIILRAAHGVAGVLRRLKSSHGVRQRWRDKWGKG